MTNHTAWKVLIVYAEGKDPAMTFFFPRDGKNERTLKKKKERKGKKKHLCELAIEITLSTPVHVCAAPGRVHHNTVFLYLRKFY